MTPKERKARCTAASRFHSRGHYYYYARAKLALDPAYPAMARQLRGSRLPILDVGCGIGLLAAYLRAHGEVMPIRAFDIDCKKIGWAKDHLRLPDVELFLGDAANLPQHSGDVVILDILHYFSPASLRLFLDEVAARVAPGGQALIRCGIRAGNWRYVLTLAEEWMVNLSGWIPKCGWHFPTQSQVLEPFLEKGFTARVRPMWGRTPFNSYLFEFVRSTNA